jgi:hypothetical protein
VPKRPSDAWRVIDPALPAEAAVKSARDVAAGPPPMVRLGELTPGGLAPAIMAIVERGVRRHPARSRSLRCEVELCLEESYPPVRIVFGEDGVLVEDGSAIDPDLRVRGRLGDLISLMAAPALRGVPVPIGARGRAALGTLVSRRVRIQGRTGLMRELLAVLRV